MTISMHCPNCKTLAPLAVVTNLPNGSVLVKCPECDKTNIVTPSKGD